MTPTIWPARRVGDEFRCGRVVDGRMRCPGVIAFVDKWAPERGARYETGTVEHQLPLFEYEQDDGIANQTGILHLRNMTRERPRRGSTPKFFVTWPVADFPFTRRCPVCDCIAQVDTAVLDSE